MFIELNELNEIISSANFKFSEKAIETNKEIVRGIDGKLYFKDEEPSELEYKKNQEILKLKEDISNEIFNVYPLTKQLNIVAQINSCDKKDFTDMKNFIEDKINLYKIAKSRLSNE